MIFLKSRVPEHPDLLHMRLWQLKKLFTNFNVSRLTSLSKARKGKNTNCSLILECFIHGTDCISV